MLKAKDLVGLGYTVDSVFFRPHSKSNIKPQNLNSFIHLKHINIWNIFISNNMEHQISVKSSPCQYLGLKREGMSNAYCVQEGKQRKHCSS